MAILLGVLIFSFLINALLFIPFINLLYHWKFQRKKQATKDAFMRPTPIFDRFHKNKAGTPVGGGILTLGTTTILFSIFMILFHYFWVPITSIYSCINNGLYTEIKIVLFTFISFGMLGFFDDVKKIFLQPSDKFFGLRLRYKLVLEIILAIIISYWFYRELGIQFINVPFFGVFPVGPFYIPFASFVIVAFANAFNITDGLDGLASGLLMIALAAFWVIAGSLLDTPLSLFIALWLGALVAFLYFNVHPARIFLGDVGALSFGATLAVIGLLMGRTFSLIIIGGLFVSEAAASLLQLLSKKFLKRKFFKVAPLHLWLQEKGWEEPKVVMRAWLTGIMLAIFGLWLAVIK